MTFYEDGTQINNNLIFRGETDSSLIFPTRNDNRNLERRNGNHAHSTAQNAEDKACNDEDSSAGSSLTELKQLLQDLPSPKEVTHLTERVALLSRRIRRNRAVYRHLQDSANRIEEKDEKEEKEDEKEEKKNEKSSEKASFPVDNLSTTKRSRDARVRRRAELQQKGQLSLRRTMVVTQKESTFNATNVGVCDENSDETITSRNSSAGFTNDSSSMKTIPCQATTIEYLNKDEDLGSAKVPENSDRFVYARTFDDHSRTLHPAFFTINLTNCGPDRTENFERRKNLHQDKLSGAGFNSFQSNLYRERISGNDLQPALPAQFDSVKGQKYGGYRPFYENALNFSPKSGAQNVNTFDETMREKSNRAIAKLPLSSPASKIPANNANLSAASTRSEPVKITEKLSPAIVLPVKNIASISNTFVRESPFERSNALQYKRFPVRGITETLAVSKPIRVKATNETLQEREIVSSLLENNDDRKNDSGSSSSTSTESEMKNVYAHKKLYDAFNRNTENVKKLETNLDEGEAEIYENTNGVKIPTLFLTSARSTGQSMTSSDLSFKENVSGSSSMVNKTTATSEDKFCETENCSNTPGNYLTKSRSKIPVKITDCGSRNHTKTKNIMVSRKYAKDINNDEYYKSETIPITDSNISTETFCINCQENSGPRFWQKTKSPVVLRKVLDSKSQSGLNSVRLMDSESYMSRNYRWGCDSIECNAEVSNVPYSSQKFLRDYTEVPCVPKKDVISHWIDESSFGRPISKNLSSTNISLDNMCTQNETEIMFCNCEANDSFGKMDENNEISLRSSKYPENLSMNWNCKVPFMLKLKEKQRKCLHERRINKALAHNNDNSLIIEDLDVINPDKAEGVNNDNNSGISQNTDLPKHLHKSTNTTNVIDEKTNHPKVLINAIDNVKQLSAEVAVEQISKNRQTCIKLLQHPKIDDGKHSPKMTTSNMATICVQSQQLLRNDKISSKQSNQSVSFKQAAKSRNAYRKNTQDIKFEGTIGDCKIRHSTEKLQVSNYEKKSSLISNRSRKPHKFPRSHKFFKGFCHVSKKKRVVGKKKGSDTMKSIRQTENSTIEFLKDGTKAELAKPIASESTAYFMRRAEEFTVLPANFSLSTSKLADITDTAKESSQINKKSQERFPFTISETVSAMSSKFKLNFENMQGTNSKPQCELQENEYRLDVHPSILRIANKGFEETPYEIVTGCICDEVEERPNNKHLLQRLKGFVRKVSNRLNFQSRKSVAETDDGTMEVIYKNNECREGSPIDSYSENSLHEEEDAEFCIDNQGNQMCWLVNPLVEDQSSQIFNGLKLKKAQSREHIALDAAEPRKVFDASATWVEDLENDSANTAKGTELWSRSRQDSKTFAHLPRVNNRYSSFTARSSRRTQSPECPEIIRLPAEQSEIGHFEVLPTQKDCRRRSSLTGSSSWTIRKTDGKGKCSQSRMIRTENDLNIEAGCFCLRICRLLSRFSTGTLPKSHNSVRQIAVRQ